jgi:phosphoribosylanthranilate isomerase
MNNLKLKVCGMKDSENIQELSSTYPDFIGFIFYNKSPRFGSDLDEGIVNSIPSSIKKVGVFVNERIETILRIKKKYALDYVQLHGDEDVVFSRKLKENGVAIIKVFRLKNMLPNTLKEFEPYSDYFLFDTASSGYGGAGYHFDWSILENYHLRTPFLLSGGIELNDLSKIKKLDIKGLVGIDVNSRFEVSPGLKDLKKVKELKAML